MRERLASFMVIIVVIASKVVKNILYRLFDVVEECALAFILMPAGVRVLITNTVRASCHCLSAAVRSLTFDIGGL